MNKSARELLEIYISKSNKLSSFNFDKHVQTIGLGFSAKKNDSDEWEWKFDLPDDKERDAFLMTFRLFIQKNEEISFSGISELCKNSDLSDNWKNEATKVISIYKEYINGFPSPTGGFFPGNPTRWDIMSSILYGEIAHTNNKKAIENLKKWKVDEIREFVLYQEFTKIITRVFTLIEYISHISQEEINSLAS